MKLSGSNTQHVFFTIGIFKDVVAGSNAQHIFFTMNPSAKTPLLYDPQITILCNVINKYCLVLVPGIPADAMFLHVLPVGTLHTVSPDYLLCLSSLKLGGLSWQRGLTCGFMHVLCF